MDTKYCCIILIIAMLAGCESSDNVRTYQGYVEGENIYLASPYSGVLKKLLVRRGQHVQRGQSLFVLDQNPEELIVKQGEANLLQANKVLNDLELPRRTPEIEAIKAQIEQADAEMKLAELRVNRYSILLEKKVIDKDTVDAAITRYREQKNLKAQYEQNLQLARLGSRDEQIKAQEAQVISLTARLNEVKWQLAQKSITAPDDGFIFDTYFREGEFVPNQQPVLSLLAPQYVRIEFYIPLDKLASVHIGQLVHFNCIGCKDNNEAEINYISPEAQFIPPLVYSRDNSDKLVFRIKAMIKNSDQFKPGQPVSVILP